MTYNKPDGKGSSCTLSFLKCVRHIFGWEYGVCGGKNCDCIWKWEIDRVLACLPWD